MGARACPWSHCDRNGECDIVLWANVTKPPHNAAPPTPSIAPDTPEVLARIRDGLDLVEMLCSQVRRQVKTKLVMEELLSFGREGLLRAARSFDESRGVPFRCWATLRVRGAIIDGVRSHGDLPRRAYERLRALEAADAVQDARVEEDAANPPRDASDAEARLESYLTDMATAMAVRLVSKSTSREIERVVDEEPTPEDDVAEAELAEIVRLAIADLPDAERTMMQRHYFDDTSLDEAAKEMGLSRSWGSRLHARAIERVRRDLKRRRVVP
jgi:RNA polymerase sigma factor for flagellar operon FliA